MLTAEAAMDKFGFEKIEDNYYAVYCGPARVGFVRKTASLWWGWNRNAQQIACKTRREAAQKLLEQMQTRTSGHVANI